MDLDLYILDRQITMTLILTLLISLFWTKISFARPLNEYKYLNFLACYLLTMVTLIAGNNVDC